MKLLNPENECDFGRTTIMRGDNDAAAHNPRAPVNGNLGHHAGEAGVGLPEAEAGEDDDEGELIRPRDSSSLPVGEGLATSELDLGKARIARKKWQNRANLFVLAFSELLGGFTFSLLSPFYTSEATDKGLTVTETGLVYGSVFITTIVTSPIFGKYIESIGSRQLFIYGTFLAGVTNVIFGFLQWVDDPLPFLILSLLIRMVSAVGESAFFCAVYPLAAQAVDSSNQSTVLSVMETMFGLGLMVGPFLGAVLYEVGGFYLPFAVCGSVLVLCAVIALFLLKPEPEEVALPQDAESNSCISDNNNGSSSSSMARRNIKIREEKTTFSKLLRMPTVLYSCFILCVSGISVSWYLPSLQPFVETTFELNSIAIGTLFLVDGATYAIFSPMWGYLLDHYISPFTAFLFGNVFVLLGYLLLGPAPFFPFLPKNVYLVGTALAIHGFGIAANFIATLTFMMDSSVKQGGAPNTETTRGMITSIWFMNESVGDYIGATAGGFAFDVMGFENGTVIVIGLQVAVLVSLPLFWRCLSPPAEGAKALKPGREDRQPLLGSGEDANHTYHAIA